MAALPSLARRLATTDRWRYRASNESASEPAAWTALALAGAGDLDAASRAAEWLASLQQSNGSVGVSATQPDPRWPTSLALLAWCTLQRLSGRELYKRQVAAAAQWALGEKGLANPRWVHLGHNTELVGWSWAANTHSWLEPTCMFVLGLKAGGYADHPRVREGVELIVDRLLPRGGANYGNTIVLGQELRPHVQPTGLAMLALAGEAIDDVRIAKSLDYLAQAVAETTSPASLAFACLGLAAHDREVREGKLLIEERLLAEDYWKLKEYEAALLLLASQPIESWLALSNAVSAIQVNIIGATP